MTIKNKTQQIDIKVIYKDVGNWNYKNTKNPVCTKPIAVISIDEDEFVFSHDDLFKLLQAYLDVDERSIAMIKDKKTNTGEIDNFETPFINKIKNFLKDHGNKIDDVIKVDKQSRFNF